MKKILCLSVLLCLLIAVKAQLNTFNNIPITVNNKETTHLIFSTDVKYLSNGDDKNIGCEKPEGVNNLVRVRARNEDFSKTNLSVATADGKFYSFVLEYKEYPEQTAYFIGSDKTESGERVNINLSNPVHFIFDEPILYYDRGNSAITLDKSDDLQNVLKVIALDKFETKTNVSVATENNFYSYYIYYNEDEKNFTYYVGEPDKTVVLLEKSELSDQEKKDILDKISNKGRTITHLGVNKNKIHFAIYNVFVRNNKIIIRFRIENNSNIKYDASNMLFEIIDSKATIPTTSQENDKKALFIDSNSENFTVAGKTKTLFTVCFEKFTIPDKKVLRIYIDEQGGGRKIDFKMKNEDFINAETI